MSPILSSSGLVFATAMVVSSTAVFLAFFRQNKTDISESQLSDDPNSRPAKTRILRSCLSLGGNKDRKKKKVRFVEINVNKKKKKTNGEFVEEFKKKTDRKFNNICRNEIPEIQIQGMPENRIALYNGILRDRSQRMGFSY